MDTFFAFLKKSLVAIVFVIFAFVGTYVPHNLNKVETAHAVFATEVTQILNNIQLFAVNLATTASAAYDAITSWATDNLYIKEYVLDGIAWSIAKAIVSQMVQSLVSWINSGFQGSPAFVQDLDGFLRNAADSAIGGYLEEITGLGSFICSPFRLDIGIAIATQYQQSRVGQPARTCTLTGIIDNIEGFTSGVQGSFGQDGWNDWIDMTSSPEIYTPYGAYLSAEAGAQARILNTKGEELAKLNFGDGFLSGEICQAVSGSTQQDCFISKPGKIIQEALTFNLDSGRQALITADEIDEIIAALLGQLANQAITGAAGLLGLGGGNGSVTGASGSFNYTPAVTASNEPLFISLMQNTRSTLKDYSILATTWRPTLQAYAADTNNPIAKRNQASVAAGDAQSIMFTTANQINNLNQWLADYTDPNTSAAAKTQIFNAYNSTAPYWTNADISASQTAWTLIVK